MDGRRPAAVSPLNRFCSNISLLFRQFLLLLAKNFLLQVRRPILTGFELLVPIVAVGVLVAFRLGIPSLGTSKQCYRTFGTDQLTFPTFPGIVYYAPNTQEVQALANILSGRLSEKEISLVGVATQTEFITMIQNTTGYSMDCISKGAGIYFEEVSKSDIKYTIRMNNDFDWNIKGIQDPFQVTGARTDNTYLSSGFMQLQKLIDESIIEWKTGSPPNVDVNIRQFPYPDYNQNFFLQFLQFGLPLFMVLSLMLSVGIFVKELVSEKASRMKETMRMMGLSNWILISTWYTKQILFYLFPILAMAVLLKYGKIYPQSNLFLLFVLLLLYFMTAVAFTFLVSVWFTSPWLAMFAGFIAWFLSFFPSFFPQLHTLSFGGKMGCSVVSNICIGYIIEVLTTLEIEQGGLQFSNIATPVSVSDDLNMGYLWLMMLVDTIFYMSLYWYIDAVKPGKYGTPRPLYFPFVPSFWFGSIATRKPKPEGVHEIANPAYDKTAHEPDPTDLDIGISIKKLSKRFGGLLSQAVTAVDNLSLNMYKGQVTALLGHNGAGKTTTMSILTGLYTPTAGNAYINGYSVLNEMDLVRRSLGICPQHNVLYEKLTVKEHLIFFSMLKGMPAKRVMPEVNMMINDLQLADKRNILARKLSGGMKRKLSVGIALIGQSEVVILDEPTSGMDPYARRATWDLLIKHKENRTILLTTHFMDEADVLGDRIAIMAEGQLRCSGSSLFLKSRFGVGYHMTIVKEPDCDSSKVINVVKEKVDGSKEVTDVGAELSFILPTQSKGQFPDLFDILEDHKADLGISSFGVSITTMEEVFIKVGQGDDATVDSKLVRSTRNKMDQSLSVNIRPSSRGGASLQGIGPGPNMGNEKLKEDRYSTPPPRNTAALAENASLLEEEKKTANHINGSLLNGTQQQYGTVGLSPYRSNTGIVLWFQQVFAIFFKHLLHAIRFWPSLIWQLFVPLLFVTFSLILVKTLPGADNGNPSRTLTLGNVAPSKTINFFQAGFGGESFPFRANETSTVGISSLESFTDDVNKIKQGVANFSAVKDCCSYEFQILDKFCASRKLEEFQQQCKDEKSFGLNSCQDCFRCVPEYSSTSCTNPVSFNDYNGCPISPQLSFSDLLSEGGVDPIGPLDGYNTYMAEKLLQVSGGYSNPNEFFRIYQGGFVIHPESFTYSTCGNSIDSVCNNLAPALSYNYPQENDTRFNDITAEFLTYSVNQSTMCLDLFMNNITSPSCNSSTDWNSEYNWAVESCIDLETSNSCKDNKKMCESQQYVGTIAEPLDSSSRQSKITLWYNNQPYHMAPAVLNSYYSLYLQHAGNGHTITVTNHPLPKRTDEAIDDSTTDASMYGYASSYISVFGTCFLFSSFVMFLIQEKQSKAKHIQFVSGVGSTSYWLGTFLYDVLNALVPTILIVIVYAAFNVDGFKNENLGAIFLLFFLSTWAAIPISYLFSFLFTNALVAFALLIMLHYFVFLILLLTVSLVAPNTAKILYYIFLIHPTFGLGNGLTDMYINQITKDSCNRNEEFKEGCTRNEVTYLESTFSFHRPGINWTFIYLFVEGIVFFTLTLLLERGFFIRELFSLGQRGSHNREQYNVLAVEPNQDPNEDSDVADEREKVMSRERLTENDVVLIKDLRKVYYSPLSYTNHKTAVNGINLVIPTGECFGLLGVNGAGKTTTFNMLTGDVLPTSGTATIAGYDIRTQLHEVQQQIGYCPQFDAIIELLTGRELLTMFARLRGVPERSIKAAVQFEIDRLDLRKHADKRCGNYSGGNKRKLSTAIALIGNPPIIFLDEPTTGMDPVTRRFLWDALINIVAEGRSVIITSHSMEECEALCSRLAIMVNGKFKCLGSTQHLKSKFGRGYQMQLKVSQNQPTHQQTQQPRPLEEAMSTQQQLPTKVAVMPSGPPQQQQVPPQMQQMPPGPPQHQQLPPGPPREQQLPPGPPYYQPQHVMTGAGPMAPHQQQLLITASPFMYAIKEFVAREFPGSRIDEEHQNTITYQIPTEGVTWSSMFRKIEENKERLGIEDYSISQTTLDQIFINFAKEQDGGGLLNVYS